ncbi:MAG: sugar phosphate isomerase/epimerase [Planctomycetaceae bacterium]|nr:sugar phosphate isomerase/epimerase [Planctomycetaceae bacterium]
MKRRQFLSAALAVTGASLATTTLFAQESKRLHVAINQYTCNTIYRRENLDFWDRLDELKSAGLDGIEPLFRSEEEVETVGKRLADYGLTMRSVYSGINLHEEDAAEKEINRILKIGEKVKSLGTSIIVVNPAGKKGTDAEKGKTDAELIFQSKNFDILGAGLKKIGISLAFHYHKVELEFAAREFHHILCGTDPNNVSLCFEQNYSYSGSGNSQVALFDHLKLYGDRSVEVHLRQTINNVFSETFGDGDIDNIRLAAAIRKLPKMPHIVLEQAVEAATPKTMPPVEKIRQSVDYVRKVFG